jgi:arylsulfatase A-like enzyme
VPALVKLPRQHKPLGPLRAATQVKDLLPTMLELAGVRAPIDTYKGRPIVPISGTSLVGALTSNDEFPQIRLPGTALALEFFGQGYVLQDHWKLSLSVAPGETPSTYATVPWRLYDMDKDRGETRDLARNYPEVVGRLTTEWERYVQSNRVLMPVRPPTPKRDPNAL